jgi:glycosyltransferase involved in cell wall biosynthesis
MTTADPRAGGPVEAARNFGTLWAGRGHVHDLLTLDPPGFDGLPGYPGSIFAVGGADRRSLPGRYRYAPRFVPALRERLGDYDAVIVSGLWRYHVPGTLQALRGTGVPVFVFTHGMLDPWFRKRYPFKHAIKQASWWLAEGPLLRRAAGVLFTCEEERVLAHNAFRPYAVKAACVGYGTRDVAGDPAGQIAAFRAAMPQLQGRRFLLFLSRIHEKKGCDLLVDAFAQIAQTAPDCDLVIAGPDQAGLVAGLRVQARRHGLAARVHFPGMLAGAAKFGAFRAAEAFALTSHQENFGIVVAEALACATPVLISDKVNIWREINEDGAGLVESDTRAGAARLLQRFFDLSPDVRLAMRQRARACFEARFCLDAVADRLMALIEAEIAAARATMQPGGVP